MNYRMARALRELKEKIEKRNEPKLYFKYERINWWK
jgi:hypothetical protein